jgi:hypothetical protein
MEKLKAGLFNNSAEFSISSISQKSDMVMIKASAQDAKTVTRFGAVEIWTAELETDIANKNIREGRKALKRGLDGVLKPGVKIQKISSIPLYYGDPKDTSKIIRDLDGVKISGTFVRGKFRAINA